MLRRTGSRRRRSFIESMLLCSCLLLYILLERMNIFVSNIRVNDLVGKESCRSITRVETLKYKLDLELSTNCTFTIDKLAISIHSRQGMTLRIGTGALYCKDGS